MSVQCGEKFLRFVRICLTEGILESFNHLFKLILTLFRILILKLIKEKETKMSNPFYPSLIPRYVDESWFANDQPVDEAAKLNELEANHEVWIREAHYRTVDVHNTPHIEPIDGDANEDDDDDDDGINEDDEDDEEDMEGEDIEDEFIAADSPPIV